MGRKKAAKVEEQITQEPAQEVKEQTFAEKVGKSSGYSAAGITDVVAGVRLREHQNPYLSIIAFQEKPSDPVRLTLKENGFRWNKENEEWVRPISFDTRVQDRLLAERTFDAVVKQVRAERGIEHSAGISAA